MTRILEVYPNRSPISIIVVATALTLLFTGTLIAQTTTGTASGVITDEGGGVLPGVTVEIKGPVMQGVRTVVTDEAGHYRFVNLPPGAGYEISANLPGFQPTTKSGVRIVLNQEATNNFSLQAALTEAIIVTADAPLVDVTNTQTGLNITTEQFESLPTTRDFQKLTEMAPGVAMEMGDSRDNLTNSPNVGASSAPENNYIIDGLSTTDPRFGTSGTNLTMNFVQEVQVMTGGYDAEFGRSTGGVFNVITKSGGNSFSGDVFGYYSSADWSPERARRANKQITTLSAGSDETDFGLAIGGPIIQDRLWFFGAYNPAETETFVGGAFEEGGGFTSGEGKSRTADTDNYAGKLTFTATPNHSFVLSTFGDPTKNDGWGAGGPITSVFDEPGVAIRASDGGSDNLTLRYSGIATPNFLVEASAGAYKQDRTLAPATDIGRSVPRQIDETLGGVNHGGFQRFQTDEATRDSYILKFSNYLSTHELRYGIDFESNEYIADLQETWYRYFGPTYGADVGCQLEICDYIQERAYFVQGEGKTDGTAFFIQDHWKVLPNVQLNIGLRYEEQKISSARGVALASNEDEVHAPITQGSYTFDDNWAPRIGIVWDPMNNGRSKVYAYGGRFYEAMPLDINIRAVNGEDYIISRWMHPTEAYNSDTWYNPSGSPVNSDWLLVGRSNLQGATLTPIDSNLKMQYKDQYILGGEYQFSSAWSAGLRWTHDELGRVIEDFGTFGNPDDPLELTGYVIGNPGEGFFGAPYDAPNREYDAIELTLTRAFVDNWQLVASYVYSQAEGNYEGLYMSGYEQLDPNITALYDIPSFLNNAQGTLRADRPYLFKVYGSYAFPFGLTVSEGFQYSAGLPISAQGPEIYNGYGDGTIFLTPRGSEGRTDDFWNLDLHADYVLPFLQQHGSISIIVDVFNVFDNDEALEVDQDYVYEGMDPDVFSQWTDPSNLDEFGNPKYNASLPHSEYYGTPILFQAPRRVQIGVKYSF